jgi:hypothetical protein
VNAIAPGLTDTAQPRCGSTEEELTARAPAMPWAGWDSRGHRQRRGISGIQEVRLHDWADCARQWWWFHGVMRLPGAISHETCCTHAEAEWADDDLPTELGRWMH